MEAPLCRLCGKRHYTYESHAFDWLDSAVPPVVANVVANSKHGKYADKEKRKTYQRDLMRKRRAGGAA